MKKYVSILLIVISLFTISACTKTETKHVDLNAVYGEFEAIMPEMMLLDESSRFTFLGIPSDNCKQAITAICSNGLRSDEIWLIEAKDAEAFEQITELMNSRLAAKKEETISYSPEQYAVVEKAAMITHDLYIAFIVSPDVDTLKSVFEAAFN